MSITLLKLMIFSSLIFSMVGCAGRNKTDRDAQPATAAAAEEPDPFFDDVTGAAAPKAEAEPSKSASQDEELSLDDDPNVAIATKNSKAPVPDSVPYADENTVDVRESTKATPKTAAAPRAAKLKPGVPPQTALRYLRNGNTRFAKQRFRADGQSAADRARLLAGQKPHSIVFTCSDSRVPPEVVFDQKLGEIYVVRTEQLTADKAAIWSLERGALLGAQLLVILGHDNCAAETIKASGGITTQSATLAELVNTGALQIQAADYNLKTGVVTFE